MMAGNRTFVQTAPSAARPANGEGAARRRAAPSSRIAPRATPVVHDGYIPFPWSICPRTSPPG